MTTIKPLHTFHIQVMGLAYTIDSPESLCQRIENVFVKMLNWYKKGLLIFQIRFTLKNYNLPLPREKNSIHINRIYIPKATIPGFRLCC